MNTILAVVGALAVALGFVTAVLGLLNARRQRRSLELAQQTDAGVQTIKVQVNGHLSELIEALQRSVPAGQPAPAPPPPAEPPAPPSAPPPA